MQVSNSLGRGKERPGDASASRLRAKVQRLSAATYRERGVALVRMGVIVTVVAVPADVFGVDMDVMSPKMMVHAHAQLRCDERKQRRQQHKDARVRAYPMRQSHLLFPLRIRTPRMPWMSILNHAPRSFAKR